MAAGKGDSRNGRDMLIERRYGAGPEGADFAYDFIHRQRKDELITENWFNAMKCPAYGHLMGWCKDPERSQKEAARAKQLETGLAERERIRLNRLRFDWARRRPNPKLLEKYYTPPPELPQCRDYPACPMYPVHPEMSRWLYMGTRNDETGSGIYLKLRQYCPPETKYTLPPTTTAEYGWRLGEACSRRGTDCFRSNAMRRTFWRRMYSLPEPHTKKPEAVRPIFAPLHEPLHAPML